MSSPLHALVLQTARALNASGINRGSAGNVSARSGNGFVITPTGMAYERSQPGDMVRMGMDGRCLGPRKGVMLIVWH